MAQAAYDHKSVEKKWRDNWEKSGIYKTPTDVTSENKYYILPQLPYPSGSGLHVGHAEVYSACDIYARFKRMKGNKVLQVIGWDAFGLPAENYAIKTNIHPRINTDQAVDNFRDQIKKMGVSVDWDREVGSHNADYYKWTQWFFLLMYNQGLAYRKNQKVNWCPSCKTVLANEQVIEKGDKEVCERCDSEVEHKMMEQWYLKITDYADRLYFDLDKIDWPAETVKRQKDWIGRSEGALVNFALDGSEEKIEVFTTAYDTIFGATFVVLAPEHQLVNKLKDRVENWGEVEEYIKKAGKKTEIERTDVTKEKTGVVMKGIEAINPLNNKKIPVFVADYALVDYGTGAVMGVPGHDDRDGEFAKKYNLDIINVVKEVDGFISYTKDVKSQATKYHMVNSGKFDGMDFKKGKAAILAEIEKLKVGEAKIQYKLRDWSVSRQRFWGAPIPMIYTPDADSKKSFVGNPDFVLSAHAYESDPSSTYHPWIDEQLKENYITTVTPELPGGSEAKFDEWVKVLEENLPENTENTVVTGRSLGSWAALKVAQKHKLRKLILVCPANPSQYEGEGWEVNQKAFDATPEKLDVLREFVVGNANKIDFEKVAENVGEIVVFLSQNDPYVHAKSAEEYFKKALKFARIRRFRDAGHFRADNGFEKFPELLKEIRMDVRPGLKPLQKEDLPVILPDDVDFKPTGESPLRYSPSFQDGVEEKFGKGFRREVDTLDTFMCSSWYYFRYLDPKNENAFASEEALKAWMPVDFYLGGPEHVNGHLLYSRFFTKVLYDAGYVDFDEPFAVHRHQGLILGEDNRKMSKRWGNVVNPTDVVEEHGGDTLRMYEMFMGPLSETKPWSSKGVMGVRRFLNKVWVLNSKVGDVESVEQEVWINKLIKKAGEDIEALSFNTTIAKMMEFTNFLNGQKEISKSVWEKFMRILAPFAPFMTEEIWESMGNTDSIHVESWPEFDETMVQEEQVVLTVQVNGKVRDTLNIARGASQSEVEEAVKSSANVAKYLSEGEIKKVIFVPDRIINFVVA